MAGTPSCARTSEVNPLQKRSRPTGVLTFPSFRSDNWRTLRLRVADADSGNLKKKDVARNVQTHSQKVSAYIIRHHPARRRDREFGTALRSTGAVSLRMAEHLPAHIGAQHRPTARTTSTHDNRRTNGLYTRDQAFPALLPEVLGSSDGRSRILGATARIATSLITCGAPHNRHSMGRFQQPDNLRSRIGS